MNNKFKTIPVYVAMAVIKKFENYNIDEEARKVLLDVCDEELSAMDRIGAHLNPTYDELQFAIDKCLENDGFLNGENYSNNTGLLIVAYSKGVQTNAGWRSKPVLAIAEKISDKRVKIIYAEMDNSNESKRQDYNARVCSEQEIGVVKNISSLKICKEW